MGDPVSTLDRLKQEWAVIGGAKYNFLVACLIVAAACWGLVYWHFVGTITEKDATIETQKTALDRADKENDNLRKQLADANIPRVESGIPLKKRVQILSDQLEDFGKRIQGNPDQFYGEYIYRFESRVKAARVQLDEAGLNSQPLDTAVLNDAWSADAQKRIMTIATEFRKLAEKTPDDIR